MKTCIVCDDPLPEGRRRFCSDMCQRINWRRKHGRGMVVATCECGTQFIQKTRNHKKCAECGNPVKGVIGSDMVCIVCGDTIERTSVNKICCSHKCRPMPGMTRECPRCHEIKPYAHFYDYRDRDEGKFRTTCKACLRAESRASQKLRKSVARKSAGRIIENIYKELYDERDKVQRQAY